MIRLAALMISLAGAAAAQDIATDALDRLADAEAQLLGAETADDRLAALTQAVAAYDASLGLLREAARDVAEAEAAQAATLSAQEAQIARLLGVLTTVDRTPDIIRRAQPMGPVATYRAGLLVAGMTPVLEAEAARLEDLLGTQRALADQQAAVARALEDGREGALAARAALETAMGEGGVLPLLFEEDPVEATLLAASAESLGAFARSLAEARPDPETTLERQGNLALPVAGLILPNDGSGRPGVRIATAPRALVTTPVTATVLFQGPLLDYGTVVLLEPAPDLIFVLAGLHEVFAETGRILPAGAPIGLMPDTQSFNDGILTENMGLETGQPAQSLYLEVREGQTASQTDAWFALE
ncbi:murein hydrolase activator EnvC family protein [Yoonia sp.]|uniref:murein hydrolase activator EnvC family protein n=1 Tax=Yoonia sp. TaxID=2212373 RepID=UPI002FD9B28B